jgi:hypothetical protein
MPTVRFEVGDRVRVRISTPFVRAGTLGTIQQVYHRVADAYKVRFDQISHHWVMQACDLERLSAAVLDIAVQDVIANEETPGNDVQL